MIADTLKGDFLSANDEARLVNLARERVGITDFSVPTSAAMDARERLIAAYMPAISKTVRSSKTRNPEDLESELVATFLELLETHDPSRARLSTRVNAVLFKRSKEFSAEESTLNIPTRSLARFYSIFFVQAAGSYSKALDIVTSDPTMSHATFVAIARALSIDTDVEPGAFEAGELIGTDEMAELDEDLVPWLLNHLDEGSRFIIELFYGFVTRELEELRVNAGYKFDEQLSDEQVAALDASPVHSKRQVIRRRQAAITIMRRALNLEDDQ